MSTPRPPPRPAAPRPAAPRPAANQPAGPRRPGAPSQTGSPALRPNAPGSTSASRPRDNRLNASANKPVVASPVPGRILLLILMKLTCFVLL